MKRSVLRATLLALALSAPALASASPLLGDRMLAPEAQRTLSAAIRAERAAHPEHFTSVTSLPGLRPAVYRRSRSQLPSVVRELRSMGPDALLPIIDVLAFSGYPRALSAEERSVLEVGMLEALGTLRDRRAAPVLRAAFERSTSSPEALRAAARSLGAIGGDDEVTVLARAARAGTPRQAPALEGLGMSRRDDAAQVVIEVLDRATDEAVIVAAARGLTSAGSSWAQAATGRASALPARCAEALVRTFVRVRGAARDALQVAIVGVGSPETPRFIAAVRATSDAETQRRLASIERMVRRQRP